MNKLNKILLIISLAFCTICLGASIWMASVLHDSMSYGIVAIFAIGIVWLLLSMFRRKE